ncbi:hypothetical protein Ndes2437B_g08023 [Nannochloris sp. 'desiccata']
MSQPSLEVECLDQLREYIKSLGGELNGEWKCRAQVRDYGSRAGSVDTWFTSPEGEVYRSKVAAARGCGLDPSRGTNTKRPKAPRKSSTRGAAKDAQGDKDEGGKEAGSGEGEVKELKEGGKSTDKSAADGENGNTNNAAAAAVTEKPTTAPAKDKKKGGGTGGGANANSNDAWKWATGNSNAPRPVDLSIQELGELLMSMPESFDVDDCYEGPLYYKEAQLRHAAKLARAAAQAASAAAAELEAAELKAAQAVSLAEAEAKQARRKENAERAAQECAALIAAVNDKKGNDSRPSSAAADVVVEKAAAGEDEEEENKEIKDNEDEEDVEMLDAEAPVVVDGEERKKKQVNYNEMEGPAEEEKEEEEEEEEEEEPDLDGGRKKGKGSRRNTRHSLATAVAAAAAILQDQSGTQLPASIAAAAADAAGFLSGGAAEDGTGDENLSAEPGPPPGLELWDTELEVIRKCFVRVPVRLGRPTEDEPVPLSPTSRDAELTTALLTLSDTASGSAGTRIGNGDVHTNKDKNKNKKEEVAEGREGAASITEWYTKRFAIDQLTANEGEPSAVHPAGLFYLRHVEEEVIAEERAMRRDAEEKAARREAKRLEKQNALGPDGQPRPSLPKPANLSLRGKSIEEVEEALMERLSTYVTDLGGILPDGWRVKASIRQNGANAGGVDAYYYDPTGRRHKSMIRVAEVLGLEATAAAKPKTLASILGTGGGGGKRSKSTPADGGGAAIEDGGSGAVVAGNLNGTDANGAEGTGGGAGGPEIENQHQQQQQEVGGDGRGGSPKIDNIFTSENNRESSPPIGGSEEPGSARKTCGVCRTCLNPQLKKGCLANKANKKSDKAPRGSTGSGGGGGGKIKIAERRRSPSLSPTPPPPKKLTARQLAKIERLKREAAEKEARRAAAAAEEEEEEEAFNAADAAEAAAASGDEGAPNEDAGNASNEDIPAAATAAAAAEVPLKSIGKEDFDVDAEEGEDAPAAGGASKKGGKRSSGGEGGRGGSTKTETGAGVSGSKRSHAETTTLATAAGSGAGDPPAGGDDEEEEDDDDRGKRPKHDDVTNDGVPYPRRDRKQVKQQDTPGNDEESKKKKEAAKAARREKRKLQGDNEIVRTSYDRAYNRLKGQLSRLRQEQALVEAYAADGWRGASREKVKPVAEIKRAKEQIQRCKEVIRECVKVVDEAEGDKAIPAELFDEDGELDLDYIFCAKCQGNESTDDNDIILCDGHCNRAYHVKCLIPPVDPETLPEDEGWLCPSCDRKIDMIDDINDEFGTEYEYDAPWEEVLAPGTFPISPQGVEGGGGCGGGGGDPTSPRAAPVDLGRLEGLLAGADLPSDDEEDEDYAISSGSDSGIEGIEDGGGGEDGGSAGSGSDDGDGDNDSENDDSDNSSLASEDLGGEILDVEMTDAERTAFAQRYAMVESDDDDSNNSAGKLIVQGKRRRTAVDYRALNQEMFGDAETPVAGGLISEGEGEDEEDEGWSPRVQARKAREERARLKKEEEEEESEEEESGQQQEEREDGGDAAPSGAEEEKNEEDAAE